jgi:hypothetical protein
MTWVLLLALCACLSGCSHTPPLVVYCDAYSRAAADPLLAQWQTLAADATLEMRYSPIPFALQKQRMGGQVDIIIGPYAPALDAQLQHLPADWKEWGVLPDTLWTVVHKGKQHNGADTLTIGLAEARHPIRYWQDSLLRLQPPAARWQSTYEIVPALLPGYLQRSLLDCAALPAGLVPAACGKLPGGLPFSHRIWLSPRAQAWLQAVHAPK